MKLVFSDGRLIPAPLVQRTSRTVVVFNDSDGHADKRTRTILAQQFANHGLGVIDVPFDHHLRPGGVIDVNNEMSPKTRRRFYEIAAAIAGHFASTTQRRREHRSR
jgi:MinD-like ATPase involved in chromosome partitioning or flagellar assembly